MKKVLSIMLALSLILVSAVPAFAEETDSKGLEKAISQVKNVATIPSDYKDFQYSKNQYEENGKMVSLWYLNWNKEDGSAGVSATVEDNGYLTSFSKYTSDPKEGLGSITRDAGQKKAAEFLAKIRPDLATDMKLVGNTRNYYDSDRHYYNYKLYKNGAIVNYIEANIEVDKHTGEVIGFNLTGTSEDISNLPAPEGLITLDTAKKAYLEKIGVKLSYYSNYDYQKKTLTIFPAYSGYNDMGKAIDAKTGEAVWLYNNYNYYDGKGGMGGSANMNDSASNNALTKEELDAINKVTDLISKEKAESILRSLVPAITSDMKVTSTTLSRNYVEKDKYSWEIGFDGAYGIVNAKTGELISYYLWNDDNNKGNGITEEKAKAKAENFMQQVAGEKFKQSKFYETPEYSLAKDNSKVSEYSFNYYRQVNGLDFIGNGFTVIVNKASGKITHYDCTWYDNATFPAIDQVITSQAAFDLFDKEGSLELMYEKVNKGEPALVYDFKNPVNGFLIDPVNGTKIGMDGEPYKDTSIPEYTDIKGHWSEKTVLKLLENGYYLKGEKFNPNQKITQIEFLRYLYSPIQVYYGDDEFYKMLITDKIIKDNEKAPKSELTRQDAAKFIVRYLGQGKSAEHSDIFVNPFKDKITSSYQGYATICYGLGVMKGDKYGRFNGTKTVTNAEAATIIYNALQVK